MDNQGSLNARSIQDIMFFNKKRTQCLVALFVLFFLLFNFPMVSILRNAADSPLRTVFYYLIGAWLLLIALMFGYQYRFRKQDKRAKDEDTQPPV